MSLETRLRNTGQQGGGGGSASADSAGLATKAAAYILSSANANLANALVLLPGSSVTTHISGTNLYINAITNAGAATGSAYYPFLAQQAKLYSSTSAARIDAGTGVWRLLFSPTTQQYGVWQFVMPPNYGSNPYARLLWTSNSSLSVAKSVEWLIDTWGWSGSLPTPFVYMDTFGGTNSGVIALSAGYSSGTIQSMTIPLATIISFGAGNLIKLRLSSSAGAITGDNEMLGLNLEYTL